MSSLITLQASSELQRNSIRTKQQSHARTELINVSWNWKFSIRPSRIPSTRRSKLSLKIHYSLMWVQQMKSTTLWMSSKRCNGVAHQYSALCNLLKLSTYRASLSLRSLTVAQRKCLFYDELIGGIRGYNVNVCRMKCRAEAAIKLCGCKPHFYSFISECQRLNG